jgi:iron complex outermembrane receptor protein
LQANVAGFRATRKNYYVTLVAGTDARPVGEQVTDGVEVDVIGSPLPGLSITANHAAYNARIASRELSGATSIEGKKPQGVPEHSGSLWIAYEVQSGVFKGLGLGGGPAYKSKTFADALNVLEVPSYVIGNASVFYRRARWEAQVNVQNVTDEKYFSTPTFSGALPGDPLSVYATVRVRI